VPAEQTRHSQDQYSTHLELQVSCHKKVVNLTHVRLIAIQNQWDLTRMRKDRFTICKQNAGGRVAHIPDRITGSMDPSLLLQLTSVMLDSFTRRGVRVITENLFFDNADEDLIGIIQQLNVSR
jgi:hypothetical protein